MNITKLTTIQKEEAESFAVVINSMVFKREQLEVARIIQQYTFHTRQGILQTEVGKLFDDGCMLGRFCCNDLSGLVSEIKTMSHLYACRSAGNMGPLSALSNSMYSQWFNTIGFAAKDCPGLFHRVYRSFVQSGVKEQGKKFAESAVCWGDEKYRRSGEFYAYRQDPEGCILVSTDFKSVYRVFGIGQQLGEILLRNFGKLPHLVFLTVLPFCNVLTYDGTLQVAPRGSVNQPTQRRIAAAYAKALKTDTIIESLEVTKQDRIRYQKELRIIGLAEAACEMCGKTMEKLLMCGRCKSTYYCSRKCQKEHWKVHKKHCRQKKRNGYSKKIKQAIADIKCQSKKDSYWVFRRYGYTEAENPNHMTIVVDGMGTPVHTFVTKNLEPTFEEIVSELARSSASSGFCPDTIGVDHKPIMEELEKQLKKAGVMVTYYPPPSKSERSMYGS